MAHLTRYYMYNRIRECLEKNKLFPLDGKILGISGIDNFRPLISKKAKVMDTKYPEVNMQKLPFESNSFDCVISDQVIEHVRSPKEAIDESYRVLNRNGVAIHTTCFLNYIHCGPIDFWRFSPESLRYLCSDFSQILDYGGWGNRFAILLCFVSERFRYMEIPNSRWSIRHLVATYNEKKYPI
ncbi:MAG: class I SAM-dependent methyltransferase, partial [Fervidobacterium sp.]